MKHTVYILGSAQDGGLPQFGARADQDTAARLDPLARRLGPSLCILAEDGRAFLIDASPDIKEQESRLLKLPAYSKRAAGNPFDGILITHAHMGHYVGLAHFGREAANTRELPCWVTPQMADFLTANAPWAQLVDLRNIELRAAAPPFEFEPWDGLHIRVFAVPHRGEYTDTVGISINARVLYVPDIDAWEQWPDAAEEVAAHAVAILDATFYSQDELPERSLNEITHPFVMDTVRAFQSLAADRRIVLTHLNHTNPLCNPTSNEAREVAKAGFEIAQEMMSFGV